MILHKSGLAAPVAWLLWCGSCRLAALGCSWLLLVVLGCLCVLLAAVAWPGCSWLLLAAPAVVALVVSLTLFFLVVSIAFHGTFYNSNVW